LHFAPVQTEAFTKKASYKTPLLQIISVYGNYVDIVSRTYITPQYVPVLKKTLSLIKINIRDDRNRPIQFIDYNM